MEFKPNSVYSKEWEEYMSWFSKQPAEAQMVPFHKWKEKKDKADVIVDNLDKELEEAMNMNDRKAEDVQIGGDHYKDFVIQPMTFCIANKLSFPTGLVIKYVTRIKGDIAKQIEDHEKAKHVIDFIIEDLKRQL